MSSPNKSAYHVKHSSDVELGPGKSTLPPQTSHASIISMTLHTSPHPLAGETIKVQFKGGHYQIPGSDTTPQDFIVEDWWDHLTGGSWMDADGNPAALIYAFRAGMNGLPTDNDVVYGKIGPYGHLVHTSELLDALKPSEVFTDDEATPWHVNANGCFAHCDPEGWYAPCKTRDLTGVER